MELTQSLSREHHPDTRVDQPTRHITPLCPNVSVTTASPECCISYRYGGVHGWNKLRPVLVSSMSMKAGSSPN